MTSNLPETKGLDLSISDIEKSLEAESEHSGTFSKEIVSEYYRQEAEETKYLKKHAWACPPDPEEAVLTVVDDGHLDHLDIEHKKYFFLDYRGLEKLSCFIRNIVLFNSPNNRSGYNFVKNVIKNTRLVGPPSVNGFAMSSDLMDKHKDTILIKAPREASEYSMAAANHELVVGKVMNKLRAYIPNFAYVLGSFECGPPVVTSPTSKKDNGKLISWCRGGRKVRYIIYEFIQNAVSLHDYLKTCSVQEFMDIYLQMNYALMTAYNENGFTHNDLHLENILVRSVPGFEEFYIPYEGDYVYGSKIATFIDYGLSHVYITDESGARTSVGMKDTGGPETNVDFTQYGIYADKPNPIRDCYSLLLNCLFTLKHYNKDESVYKKAKGLVHYFHDTTESADDILKMKEYGNLSLYGPKSYMAKIESFKYYRFILYCRDFCKTNNIADPVVSGRKYDPLMKSLILAPALNDSLRRLISSDESESTTILEKNIRTIHDLFDILEPLLAYNKYLKNNQKLFGGPEKTTSHLELARDIFIKIQSNKALIQKLVAAEISRLAEEISQMKKVFYKKLNKQDIYVLKSKTALETYNKNLMESVQYLDTFDHLEHTIEMIEYLRTHFDLEVSQEDFQGLLQAFRSKDHREVILKLIKSDMYTIANYLDEVESYGEHEKTLDSMLQSLVSIIPKD